ncbi:MAG: hypothetical protein GQE15_06575, partial [Archangiaceae bacterium]|nr:hypothetical protein [Archangiaceae bacterium]
LYKLIGRLAQEGLGLNSYKTRIIESKSAMWNTEKSDDPSNVHFKPVTGVHIVDEVDDRGFYTRVPRRFFIPEMREFTTPPRPANVIVDSILEHTVVEAAEFRELALALSSSGTFDVLKRLIPIVEKHPAYIDYLMGMLAHFGPNITKPLREVLSKQLGQLLNSETFEMPEWHRIQIVRVLGSESFRNREAILLLLRRMSRSSGSALGRAVFDAIYNFATRGDAIEVRDYFERADPAERRAILRILNKVLPTEEARAWSKYAYHQVRDDLFALHYVRPLKQKS